MVPAQGSNDGGGVEWSAGHIDDCRNVSESLEWDGHDSLAHVVGDMPPRGVEVVVAERLFVRQPTYMTTPDTPDTSKVVPISCTTSEGGAYHCVMSLHRLTGGDGYTYLTRQVAALDAIHKGHVGLDAYYSEKGETRRIVSHESQNSVPPETARDD